MKHVIHAAYKDALRHLKHDMAKRMLHEPEPEEEGEDPAEEATESPAEEAGEDMGEDGEDTSHSLSDEEKKAAMFGRKRPSPKASMLVIGIGKKPKRK